MCLFQNSVSINLHHTLSVSVLFYPSTLECKAVVGRSDACCELLQMDSSLQFCSRDKQRQQIHALATWFAGSCCSSRTMPLWSYLSYSLVPFIIFYPYDIYRSMISYHNFLSYSILCILTYTYIYNYIYIHIQTYVYNYVIYIYNITIYNFVSSGRGDGHGMTSASRVCCVRLSRVSGWGEACDPGRWLARTSAGACDRHLEISGDGNLGKKNANERNDGYSQSMDLRDRHILHGNQKTSLGALWNTPSHAPKHSRITTVHSSSEHLPWSWTGIGCRKSMTSSGAALFATQLVATQLCRKL